MRCQICNAIIATPEWDEIRCEWAPCPKCKGEAAEILADYDKPKTVSDLFDWEADAPLPPEEGDLADYYRPL